MPLVLQHMTISLMGDAFKKINKKSIANESHQRLEVSMEMIAIGLSFIWIKNKLLCSMWPQMNSKRKFCLFFALNEEENEEVKLNQRSKKFSLEIVLATHRK